MTQVKTGDTVRIHYTGTLADGTEFDSSKGRDPLEFTVGSGQIIPGLDQAIPGMAVGDSKTVKFLPNRLTAPSIPLPSRKYRVRRCRRKSTWKWGCSCRFRRRTAG